MQSTFAMKHQNVSFKASVANSSGLKVAVSEISWMKIGNDALHGETTSYIDPSKILLFIN